MASVIVSIAMRNHHAYAISVFLMWGAGVPYTVLVVLHVWRIHPLLAAMTVVRHVCRWSPRVTAAP